MTRNILQNCWFAIVAALFLILGAGCQRKYQFSRICDYALFDGKLYLLVLHEEGIDKASRYAHSAAFQPTRRVLGVARSSVGESDRVTLELLGKRELIGDRFLNADTFQLCSTNSCVVTTDAESVEVLFFGTQHVADKPKTFAANRIAFSASRRFLLGCGKTSWVLDAESLVAVADARASESMAILCNRWTNAPQSRAVASDDLRTVVFQDESANPLDMSVVQFADTARTTHVASPDATLKLQSVHGQGADVRILLTSFAAGGEVAVILDMAGKEMGRSEFPGKPVANASGTKVVAVSTTQAMQLNDGENLPVKVWLPNQNREAVLSLDTSGVLAGLRSKLQR